MICADLTHLEIIIEELRNTLNSLSTSRSRTSEEVLKISQELDEYLIAYQKAQVHGYNN
ncbi:MAG: aspartyl-phosphate phosphatase Spo0E family protein [Firmicutes bacterium]|nr:aspartyl-phosphate phosphatase Spo0E family protein [Bacillota bacterium]